MRLIGTFLVVVALLGVGLYALRKPVSATQLENNELPYEPEGMEEAAYKLGMPVIPQQLTFCGEAVPLERPEVRERLERELLDNTHKVSQTILILKRAARWEPILKRTLQEAGVPEDLFYLAVAESELANARSRAGAQGFWQFMPGTAPNFGLTVTKEIDERDSPTRSAQAAASFLKAGYRQHKSWALAAAGYNMGPGRVSQQLREQGATTYYDLVLNRETQRYVYRILALKCILQDPAAYGFDIPSEGLYQSTTCKEVTLHETVDDLVAFAKAQGTTYQALRLYNPWIKDTRLPVRGAQSYTLYIPDSTGSVQMGYVTE